MNRVSPGSFGEIIFARLDDMEQQGGPVEADVEVDFLAASDELLTDWLSEALLPTMLDEVEDKDWCDALSQQVRTSVEEHLAWDDLMMELLDTLDSVEDREQAWLLHWMWGSDTIRELYDEVVALRYSPENCPISDELRTKIATLIDGSRLIPEEDQARFEVVLGHDGPEAVLSLLSRLLMAHSEYAESVQMDLLQQHPELIEQYQARLDDLAKKWA